MSPSPEELTTGQAAYERIEAFQRRRTPMVFLFLIMGAAVWYAFERGGWKPALGIGLVWIVLTAVSVYRSLKEKKQIETDSTYLEDLKERYGDGVFSEIQKQPHSLSYNIFQKRFPPFNRQA